MYDLAARQTPHQGRVFDVFALGQQSKGTGSSCPHTKQPTTARIRMPDTATAMLPTRNAVLQSLLTFLTPSHQKMNIPHDDWFRAVALPIVADSNAHVLATVCATAFEVATGKLDLSIQGLFGAGKSRAAAILIAGLMVTLKLCCVLSCKDLQPAQL